MAIVRTIDRRLFFVLDRAHAQIAKHADARLQSAAGIRSAQAAALVYLGYHNDCLLSELAEGVGHNNSAITGLVGRMEKAGLVTRADSRLDRRAKIVSLTEKGWAVREQVMDAMRSFNELLTKGLSESETAAVFKFISNAEQNFNSGMNS